MFENLISKLKSLLLDFDLLCERVNNNLYYFESKKYNIAYDVVKHDDFISVDFVYRRGNINKEFIMNKYPQIVGNKCRILTVLSNSSYEILYGFIKSEFLELVYTYEKFYSQNLYSIGQNDKLIKSEPLKFWFADGIPNFGDFITPWLANKFTNRPILNVRNIPSSDGAILGVGSIVQAFGENHKEVKVWGSGIISADNHLATANKLKKAKLDYVYACRGELTKKFFENFNFEHSQILGDPGLLFGSLYKPKISKRYKYAIVPHYIHYDFFKEFEIENCIVVDVRNELTSVIDQIASADNVVSTSMHGLIIAQSYNIPWLHLYINDGRLLMGEEFKFEDFFSILDRENVAQVKVNKSEINLEMILKSFNQVSLPKFKNNYSENGLIDSFYDCVESRVKKTKINSNKFPKLLFLGDSHIGLMKFGGAQGLYEPFEYEVCMASGATASGLQNLNSFTRAGEKFKEFIKVHPKNSEIVIQLGEVDCGILIWLKSQERKINPENQMLISLQSYQEFLKEIVDMGYKNIIVTSATIPTINDEDSVGEVISIRRQKVNATFKERTLLTLKFNSELNNICAELGIKFIDATEEFLDTENMLCNSKFRNKDKTDHHMDNNSASVIWAEKINNYLHGKYDISHTKIKLICNQDSFIKKLKFNSNVLNDDMLYKVNKGDVITADKYSHNLNYIVASNVTVNDKKINSSLRFVHLSHFSMI